VAYKNDLQLRLADMVGAPRESLEIELKSWLNLKDDADRANLAKALTALANHGGGYVLLGFEDHTAQEAPGRPDDLSSYSTDAVNSVVEKYAEPGFHCDVHLVEASGTRRRFPVVVVPPGRVPIRTKCDGPNGAHIQRNQYYVRRAGPKSEMPQHGDEWDRLLGRCLNAARDELLDRFRAIMDPSFRSEVTDEGRLNGWAEASMKRWREAIADVPESGAAHFPLGYRSAVFQIRGNFERPTLKKLLELLGAAPKLTGYPPFWVPTGGGVRPYLFDNCVECRLGSASFDDPAHSDFWRASGSAEFFLIRGHDEDNPELRGHRIVPGRAFDVTLPVWRTGEVLMRAAWLAQQLGADDAEIAFRGEWTGLAGRTLASVVGDRLVDPYPGTAKQDEFVAFLTATPSEIRDGLPEILQGFLRPLYELFDFFVLPSTLVVEELQKLRSRRF